MGGNGYFGNNAFCDKEDGLLAGYYDPDKRKKEIQARLDASIEEIRRSDFSKDDDRKWLGGKGGTQEDIFSMSLASYEDKIEKLKEDVNAYEGPHFTKAYRTMQGLSSKLQTDLDALNVEGRHDLRKKRKAALMAVDELAKQLAKKAHENGQSCDDCEVKT